VIIWLIGLSGAGKTTIGREVWQQWREQDPATVFLDGDILRDVWGDRLGHDVEGRARNAHRISHLCRVLDEQGINAVAAVLSIFPEWQAWNRETFSSYYEVFLDLPMEVLKQRDPKGIYAAHDSGEMPLVVGCDLPFPTPPAPDLVLGEDAMKSSPGDLARRILGDSGVLHDQEGV
jgi:adenylylsulfate kinase-like enzyme